MGIITWPHYKVICDIESMENIENIFPEFKADLLNWCFFSTDGVHGCNTTLDEIEKGFADGPNEEGYQPTELTVLIVQPRLVVIHYGVIEVSEEDIPKLRKLVNSTIKAVVESQNGNC